MKDRSYHKSLTSRRRCRTVELTRRETTALRTSLAMTSPLVPLASNDLFGGGPERKRGAHSSRAGIQVSAKSELLRCHVIQLSLQRGATQPANHATLTVSTGTKPRHERDAQLFCVRDAHPQRSVRPNRELSLCREPPNDRVDAAARIHSSIAGPIKLRNTLPPLASNDLFDGVYG